LEPADLGRDQSGIMCDMLRPDLMLHAGARRFIKASGEIKIAADSFSLPIVDGGASVFQYLFFKK
jgi:hypothetical protein